jgi:cytidylate kinase
MVQDAPSRTHPVITLDGLAGSGKSTLARRLAATLGWTYLDSGAWYRALTWAVLARGGDPAAADACAATLSDLTLASTPDGAVLVDGHAPGEALRTPAIDAAVGLVADHPAVRSELTRRMRALASADDTFGLVADGRDAGSNIFPDADLQVLVTVPLTLRAERRQEQYRLQGSEIPLRDLEEAIAQRDARDLARGDAAPRLGARGRELINEHNAEEAVGVLLSWAKEHGWTPSPSHGSR